MLTHFRDLFWLLSQLVTTLQRPPPVFLLLLEVLLQRHLRLALMLTRTLLPTLLLLKRYPWLERVAQELFL